MEALIAEEQGVIDWSVAARTVSGQNVSGDLHLVKPFDTAAPDDAPERLAHLGAIEACYSVAGEENYILKVRVASPAALENLLQEIRSAAGVSTRTTIVLSTPYENRPPEL